MFGGTAIFLIVVLAVGWMARLRIANAILVAALPDFPGNIKVVEWKDGGVEFGEVSLSGGGKENPYVSAKRIHLGVNPWSAAKGEFGVLTIEEPAVALNQKFWEQVEKLSRAAPVSPEDSSRVTLQGLVIKGASVAMTSPEGAAMRGKLDWKGGGIYLHEDGSVGADRQRVTLTALDIRPSEESLGAEAAAMEMEFSSDATSRVLTVHQVRSSLLTARSSSQLWKLLTAGEVTSVSANSGEVNGAASLPKRPAIEQVVLENVELGPLDVHYESLPWWPQLPGGGGSLRLQLRDVVSPVGGRPVAGNFTVFLDHVQLGAHESPLLKASGISCEGQFVSDGSVLVDRFEVPPMALNISPAQAASLGLPGVGVQCAVSTNGGGVRITEDAVDSASLQTVECVDLKLRLGGSEHEVLKWDRLLVEGIWSEVVGGKHLRKFSLETPVVNFASSDLEAIQAMSQQRSDAPSGATTDAVLPPWFGWTCAAPLISKGRLEAEALSADLPAMSADLSMRHAGDRWQISLDDLMIGTPGEPAAPALYRGHQLVVDIDPKTLWNERRVERAVLRGSRVQIGATAQDMQESTDPLVQNAGAQSALQASKTIDLDVPPTDWYLANLEIVDTKIYLHRLVPDVSAIQIPLAKKEMRNVPLTASGLKQSQLQERIELPMVYVPGTRAGTSVADLDTNFIRFSLAGLMRREIDQIELVNPKIYVGDSLFHYVEKLRTQAAATSVETPKTVTEVRALLRSLITVVAGDSPEPPPSSDWSILRVKAVNGKLITTVKDSPLIRVPALPFGADSYVKAGQLNAQLAVPPGLYKPLLGMELIAAITEGGIIFNLPMKQKDNNLVQVFRADWLRYKRFRVSDVTLQVTYDKNGAYAKFWAKGYRGDLVGEFNLYLDDNLSWDMWLTGTNIETSDITKTLTPASFSMTGRIDFKVIAQGDKASLYQVTGGCTNRDAGRIKVLALDEIIESLPSEWIDAQRDAVTKLLEAVRDFSYDQSVLTLRSHGMEGRCKLELKGVDGERNFDIHLHDRR